MGDEHIDMGFDPWNVTKKMPQADVGKAADSSSGAGEKAAAAAATAATGGISYEIVTPKEEGGAAEPSFAEPAALQETAAEKSTEEAAQNELQPAAVPKEKQQVPTLTAEKETGAFKLYEDFGLVSMICGIVSLVLGFSPWGILGLIFGFLSKRGKTSSGRATVGIVCSIISVAFFVILFIVFCALYVGIIMGLVNQFGEKWW